MRFYAPPPYRIVDYTLPLGTILTFVVIATAIMLLLRQNNAH